jgi:hypothetical protein
MSDIPTQRIVYLFSNQPCWMIEPLAVELKYSIPSVRRFLRQVGYYSSFTHNGGWYTLGSIPRFDRDGLWFFRDIGFSRAGSITRTLVHLINRSPAGLNAEQLGQKLRSRSHTILVQLWRQAKIQRRKSGRSYIYIAADPQIAAIQHQAHISLPVASLPAEIAVLILVEFIRHPDSSFEQLAAVITRTKHITVDASQVKKLFQEHGLKKTT